MNSPNRYSGAVDRISGEFAPVGVREFQHYGAASLASAKAPTGTVIRFILGSTCKFESIGFVCVCVCTQIKVMYSGSAAEESHGQKLVGRELCIPITFCVEPAVRVVSVSLVEQYVPAAVDRGGPAGRHYDPTYSGEEAASGGSVGTLKAGMSSLESITGPPVLLQQRSGVSEVSAGKEDTSQGWPPTDGDLPPSAQSSMSTGEKRVEKQLLIAELQPQCVLQLEVSNRGDRAFDVCLGKSQQERTEGDKDKALMSPLSVGPSQSVRLQHTLPSFPAELLASFSGQEQKQAPPPGRGPPQTVNQPVADWICSTVAVLWSAATALPTSDEPEVETKTPASGQTDTAEFADLTPLGELNGLLPLRVDSVLRALTTQVLALIAECSVFLYICPSAGRSPLRFADLRKVVPNEGLMTWRGATPLELFPGWGRSPAVDTRESADGEEMNLEVDIDQAADVDLGPTGPNGEVWGTQVGMGELLDCDIVVANRSSRTRQLVVSVCCDCLWMLGETQGPVAFGTASELVHPGVVLVGRMRKVPVEVPANTRVVHRFSVCCACPGVYQLYAVDEEPQDYPGSESGRTVSVDDFIGSVQGFRLNVLCMDPGLER
ncbi:unnamed protein product [Ostreobium quekettii]|uniref:Uncharacterized protein n=1 Tax=Ostreobium quekettii TaxID=121088 RepID=A0A8S1ISM5_9CHLO|nr:unnamed protein product [Ostreobium quekettii]